jgi:hypothetical protein
MTKKEREKIILKILEENSPGLDEESLNKEVIKDYAMKEWENTIFLGILIGYLLGEKQ